MTLTVASCADPGRRGRIMRVSLGAAVALLATCGLAMSAPTQAAEAFYLGSWTVARSVLAPWADPAHPLDKAEPSRLAGKTITFKAGAIVGPPPFACHRP